MNVYAYVRVSSASQTYALQRGAIESAAKQRGDVVVKWFSEKIGGAKTVRPELVRLRTKSRLGEIPKLYVYRLDRLSRGGIRDTLDIVDELKRYGTKLVSVADGFDLDGPAAEIVLAVLAWAAKMERAAINERIDAARRIKLAKGETWGRPRRLIRADVDRVFALAMKGKSIRQIAVALKVPKSTVGRVLHAQREALGGELPSQKRGPVRVRPALAKTKG